MMKKIATIATIFAAFVLGGCATNNVPMSDAEKTQIKNGELVKFTVINPDGEKSAISANDKIYVCIQTHEKLADGTQPCFPKLSAYFGKYLENAGFKVVSSKDQANEVVNGSFFVAYTGGHISNAYFDLCYQAIEDSLEKGDKAELTQEAMDAAYKKDITLHQEIKQQARLETAGKVLVGIIGVAMGGVNGGLNASQALTGIANPSNIEAPYGTKGSKVLGVFLSMNGKTIASMKGSYDGPLDIYQSFDKLFPEAVKSTADLFAQNVSAK